jgi:hypothetical protein
MANSGRSDQSDLVGHWHNDEEAVEMEFLSNGLLVYAVELPDRWQIIQLTYRVDGDTLITDQPSAPREERTRYRVTSDGSLVLEFGGRETHYRRGRKRAP